MPMAVARRTNARRLSWPARKLSRSGWIWTDFIVPMSFRIQLLRIVRPGPPAPSIPGSIGRGIRCQRRGTWCCVVSCRSRPPSRYLLRHHPPDIPIVDSTSMVGAANCRVKRRVGNLIRCELLTGANGKGVGLPPDTLCNTIRLLSWGRRSGYASSSHARVIHQTLLYPFGKKLCKVGAPP